MQLSFVFFLCAAIACLAAADEAADVKELIEKAIRDHAGSDELAEHIHLGVKAFEDCTSKHPEEEVTLLRKMVLPVVLEGTKCAAEKAAALDHAEKVHAVQGCFRGTDKRIKETAGLTEKETTAYDLIKACYFNSLKELDA